MLGVIQTKLPFKNIRVLVVRYLFNYLDFKAVSGGFLDTVKLLLANGADLNFRNKMLETPLLIGITKRFLGSEHIKTN
jgi:hypothetical protein